MEIRLDALIENFHAFKPEDQDPARGRSVFPIRVVEVKGETAVVSVNGRYLEVTSRVPLMPGQVFLVKRSPKEGETELWHLVREVEESSSPSVPGRSGLSEEPEHGAIVNALSKTGLPVTEENLNWIQRIMEKAGGYTPANLLVAITSLKLGIPFEVLWHWLSPFAERIATAAGNLKKPGDGNAPGNNRKPGVFEKGDNGAEVLGFRIRDTLTDLQKALRRLVGPPGSDLPEELLLSEDGEGGEKRFLVGGQIFACTRWNVEKEDPFYYIPLFTLFRGEDPPVGEILVYPGSSKKKGGGIRFILVVSTRYLGWVEVELTLQEGLLKIGMLVEEQGSKTLIDNAWPQFEEELRELRLGLVWSGCKVGRVRALLREWQEGCSNPEVYKTVDLTI